MTLFQRLELSDEELALQDLTRDFMMTRVEPLTAALESDPAKYLPDLFAQMGSLGLLGPFLPERYGGGGSTLRTRAIVSEETARVSAGLDVSMFADVVLFARAIASHGTEDQRQHYVAPVLRGEKIGGMAITESSGGSNALSPRTRAQRDGSSWVLNGTKTFITNAPIADFLLVIARTSGQDRQREGGTWFILERGMKGFETSPPFDKTGWRSSPTGEVFLSDVTVADSQVMGEAERGFEYLLRALDVERALVAASTIGIAQACLEETRAYALTREVFGQPIARFQLIQEKIASMAMGIELTRWMLYSLLRAVEDGLCVTKEAAILKLYGSQMAALAASDAVQCMGGYGYMADSKVARCFRDAKLHEIGAGTTEIMKIIIAREVLGLGHQLPHAR